MDSLAPLGMTAIPIAENPPANYGGWGTHGLGQKPKKSQHLRNDNAFTCERERRYSGGSRVAWTLNLNPHPFCTISAESDGAPKASSLLI